MDLALFLGEIEIRQNTIHSKKSQIKYCAHIQDVNLSVICIMYFKLEKFFFSLRQINMISTLQLELTTEHFESHANTDSVDLN